ncbi:hypothetical protein [Nocardia bovistercoris]|uniref:Uncharacterized protein n=1 Tax=Nocardia bovistercoris TaxID=2785916 RepID=A0A931I7E8_9NOCA|nr:hypothetical protein [Nocardia bovistercoris]MBH0776249.1 hypothetical protein [Nocardia bovistercoris]
MGAELAVELRRLEQEGRTGMLCAGDGAFHLAGGAIASVECRRTAGLDRLAVEAGVVSAREWDLAGGGDAGSLLGRPRLEALAMLSVYDAGYFLLASAAVAEFLPAPAHWLAPVCRVPPRALVRECERRGGGETGPWTADLVDRAAVVPIRGRHRRRPPLPGGQAEVLAAADSERTVAAIARDLGRTTYGCLVAVRDLTEAGLIEHPRIVRRVRRSSSPSLPPSSPSLPSSDAPMSATTPSLPLPRRNRDAVERIPDRWEPVDRGMLVRVLAALEELR